jgi:hypothetical protein
VIYPEALSLTLLVFFPIGLFVVLAVPLHLVFFLLSSILDLLVNLVALAVLGKKTVATTLVAPLSLRPADRPGVIVRVSYLEH